MTKIYLPVEMPEYCYLQEAAYWIALGRPPVLDAGYLEDPETGEMNQVDLRRRPDRVLRSKSGGSHHGYSWHEFRAIGVDIDYEKYARARARVGENVSSETVNQRRLVASALWDTLEKKGLAERNSGREAFFLEAMEWISEVERPFISLIDDGRIKLYDALRKGAVSAEGWMLHWTGHAGDLDKEPHQLESQRVPISRESWSYREIDWMLSTLEKKDNAYRSVLVKFDEVRMAFPQPLLPPTPVAGQLYGGTALLEDGAPALAEVQRRPGRQQKLFHVNDAVKKFFARALKDPDPSEKKEALIERGVEFARECLGADISRSTSRRCLEEALSAANPGCP